MPDIKTILSEEIRRLARKEIKQASEELKAVLASQKQTIAALTAKVKKLEAICMNGIPKEIVEKATAPRKHREFKMDAASIKAFRGKLKLSQKELALLLGINQITISHWESGKNVPRGAQKGKFEQIRFKSRRQIQAALKELAAAKKTVEAPADKKAKASAKKAVKAPAVKKAKASAKKAVKAPAVKKAKASAKKAVKAPADKKA